MWRREAEGRGCEPGMWAHLSGRRQGGAFSLDPRNQPVRTLMKTHLRLPSCRPVISEYGVSAAIGRGTPYGSHRGPTPSMPPPTVLVSLSHGGHSSHKGTVEPYFCAGLMVEMKR